MHKLSKNIRIFIKYLRKFLGSIVTILATVRMNITNYPFSKENKAINQDFISIGDDLKLSLIKYEQQNKSRNDSK